MCFITLLPRSNGCDVSRFPARVYLTARGEIDSFCGSTCFASIMCHQQTSSLRQTERAGVSTTRRTILIQIELAINSRCLPDRTFCSDANQPQLFVRVHVIERKRGLAVVDLAHVCFSVVVARGSTMFMSCRSAVSSSPPTKVSTFTWLQTHTHTHRSR